jgi:hypothetical protein
MPSLDNPGIVIIISWGTVNLSCSDGQRIKEDAP